MSASQPVPDYRITLDGEDLSPKIHPRLIGMTLTDKRDGEADELELRLDDTDGRLALPDPGRVLSVEIGWRRGSGVALGLVDKGNFKVDEVGHEGAPDTVTIRARSAAVADGAIRTRRAHAWHDTTIGAVVGDVAGRNGLTPRCAPALAVVAVPALVQSRESDMALIRRLGREHDAVATVKAGCLILAPMAAGVTATGAAPAPLTIARDEVSHHRYALAVREGAEGVTVGWHDRKGATRHEVTAGKGANAKRLSRVYASEASARRAANAEHARCARAPATLDLDLALGRADLTPERHVSVTGFKPAIDAIGWLIVEAQHRLDGQGFLTTIRCEASA